MAGFVLDRLLGEAKRWHPLVGFGTLANGVEAVFNRTSWRRLSGLLAWALLVLLLLTWLLVLAVLRQQLR